MLRLSVKGITRQLGRRSETRRFSASVCHARGLDELALRNGKILSLFQMLSFWKHEMSEGWNVVVTWREPLHVSASNLSDATVYEAHDYL